MGMCTGREKKPPETCGQDLGYVSQESGYTAKESSIR